MEFVVNDSHKKVIIDNEIKSQRINFHIKDSIIIIDVYSGCRNISSIENFPIIYKDLYEVSYDVDNDLYVIDDVEVDSFSPILKTISNTRLEEVKRR